MYHVPSESTGKTCVKRPLSKRQKIGFQDQFSLNAGQKKCRMLQEHSAILSTCIKLLFVIKIFVLSIFECPFYTGFTVSTISSFILSFAQVLQTALIYQEVDFDNLGGVGTVLSTHSNSTLLLDSLSWRFRLRCLSSDESLLWWWWGFCILSSLVSWCFFFL